jgi:peptidoglycan/xylan/chitin deacetylase (PgdA/CDA1 family)
MEFRNPVPRWRWHVKAGLASMISAVGAKRRSSLRMGTGYRPLVLGYHRVVEDYTAACRTEMPSMLISTAMFERHLDWLGQHFRFVDLNEVGEAVRTGVPFETPVAAITFDDGYRDIHDLAMPILNRKGIPAALFVVTDLVGRPGWQMHDKLYRLLDKGFSLWDNPRRQLHGVLSDLGLPASEILRDRAATRTPLLTVSALLPNLSRDDVGRVAAYLENNVGNGFVPVPETVTWPMLTEMRRKDFTIGSHTRTHVSLPMECSASAEDELRGSKHAIEAQLGERVDHFAYPGGQFTPAVVEQLANIGYRYAYTACPHNDPRHPELTIERLLLWEGSSIDAEGRFSSAILDCQARDLWPPARTCHRAHA